MHGAFCRISGTPSAPTSPLTSEPKGSSEVVGTPMALLKRGQAPAYLDAWDAGDDNCGVSSDDQNAMDVPHRDARSGAVEGQSHDSENSWLSTSRLPSTWPGYLPLPRVTFIPETASRRSAPSDTLVRFITTPCSLRIVVMPAPPPMVPAAVPDTYVPAKSLTFFKL